MKIIHCADLHLDSRMTAYLPEEKAKVRRVELLAAFRNMLQFARKNDVKIILIAGDLFDSRHVAPSARNLVLESVRKYAEIDFFYLRGNHDADPVPAYGGGDIPDNLHLFGPEWTCYTLLNRRGRQAVLCGAELQDHHFAGLSASLSLQPDNLNIVMLHGQTSEYAQKDRTESIGLRELRGKNIDYLALGHVHEYGTGRLDERGVWCYPGCLEGRGFDECGEHGFVLLEIEEDTLCYRYRFIPFASRTLYVCNADLSGISGTGEAEERIRDVLSRKKYPERSLIKVVLTGQVDVECEPDMVYLEKMFEKNYFFLKIEDRTIPEIPYARYEMDRSLKGEFIRTVKAENCPEKEKAEIIRIGLAALGGEEL